MFNPRVTQPRLRANMLIRPWFSAQMCLQIVYFSVEAVQFLLKLPTPPVKSRLNQGPLKSPGNSAGHSVLPSLV